MKIAIFYGQLEEISPFWLWGALPFQITFLGQIYIPIVEESILELLIVYEDNQLIPLVDNNHSVDKFS